MVNILTLGLFGYDLSTFFDDCRVSSSCDFDFYKDMFDGWAVGTHFYTDGDWGLYDKTQGFCMQDGNCFGFTVDFRSYGIYECD